MATTTKLTASNAFYGYHGYTNSAALHMYVGAENGSTKYDYRSRAAFPALYSRVDTGAGRIGISKMILYLYRNSGGATDVTVGCSDESGWDAPLAATAAGSVGASDGWYAVDITALAGAVEGYKSGWFIHISGGVPELRLDGAGKSTRPYIMVTWEYVAATITGDKASVPLGQKVTFSISPEVPGETHTLTYALGGAKGTIAKNKGDVIAWTPPESLATEIADDDTAAVQIRMTACDAKGDIQRTEVYYQTVTVPENIAPAVTDAGAAIRSGLSGYGLSGRSKLSVAPVIDMNGAYGAHLVSVAAEVNGVQALRWGSFSESGAGVFSCEAALTGVINANGTVNVTVSAVDSRGRRAVKTESFTFCDYALPVISAFSVERYEPVYDENEEVSGYAVSDVGEKVWLNIAARCSSAAPAGRQLNSLKWTVKGVNGVTGETVTASGTGAQSVSVVRDRAALPQSVGAEETWQYELTVTDTAGGKAVGYGAVAEAHAAFSVSPDKRGFAVGMIASGTKAQPKFEVAKEYEARFYGGAFGADGFRMDKARSEDLTLSNPDFAAYSDALKPRVSRVGPVVFLDGFLTNTAELTAGFSEIAAVLPEWARPGVDVSVIQQGSGQALWWLRIYTDGSVGAARYRLGSENVDAASGRQFPLTARWIAADAY